VTGSATLLIILIGHRTRLRRFYRFVLGSGDCRSVWIQLFRTKRRNKSRARIIAINYTAFERERTSQFSYDGLNRVAKIVKNGSTINSSRKIVWCGNQMCEFRGANDSATDRIYSQGQNIGNTSYYYTRDHLGPVRELAKSGGSTFGARYDYDPYGRSTTILGTTPTDVNFTGLYRHSKSNLDLAIHRAYEADLGPVAQSRSYQ